MKLLALITLGGVLIMLVMLAVGAHAAPITTTTSDPCATQICQHWYTSHIPTDTGVYPVEVYTPVLEPSGPIGHPGPQGQIVELGEPPRLAEVLETPEPSNGLVVGVIAAVAFSIAYIPILMYWRAAANEARRMVAAITSRSDRMRKALEHIAKYSLCMETRTVARKALEEK